MSTETNRRVVQELWESLVNEAQPDAIAKYVSPSFVDHTPLPGTSTGIDGLRDRLRLLHGAFPDFHCTILKMVLDGDSAALLVSSTGSHQGEFLGVPPTGKRWTILEMHLLRLSGGRMVEHWGIPDFVGLLHQLGVMNAPWAR